MKTGQRVISVLAVLVLCLGAMPLASLSATEEGSTILVRLPAAEYRARPGAVGQPLRVLDYGSLVWLELTAADLAKLEVSGLPYEVYPEPYTLRLGEQRFDTRLGGPELPAGWERIRGDGPDLHLVQFVGPTRAEWLDDLRSSGLEVVQYIHPFTYVVWGEVAAVGSVASADHVHWTGPFAPAYRVLPQWRDLTDQQVQVSVLLVRSADLNAAVREIEALGGQAGGRSVLNDTFEVAGFSISGAQLQAAAQIPGVYSIQLEPSDGGLRGEMSNQINVNNRDASNLAFPGYPDWLLAAGVDGNGVIMANVDGGVQDTHPDLVNRLISCTGQTCGGGETSDHGTHTAGIMAADGSSGVRDSYGFLRGLGMAPGANLVEQLYWPYYTWPDGMLLLMTDSYNNGASLSGNSWGPSGTPQGYDDDTMQVDIGVRDADPDVPGNQPLNYILSIMNGNGGYQTQGTPDEAKNIFTIGSTKMQTSGGAQILDINDLSANTAHGPALDGRNIPHMVAPGCSVDSTVPGGYGLMCGTSMASPHVSGAVALFVEYYRGLFGVDPSPALVKAAFLPVAHDLAGNLDADGGILGHPFDYKQGWGRMDTAAVVSPTVFIEYLDNPVIFDNTGEVWEQTLAVADPSQPARLMLVWTDAPGHGLGGTTPAWNNDLDLQVEADGSVYAGNDFGPDGWSQAGGAADYMNNTEGVFLGPVAPSSLTVRVVASNITSDGIPNQGDDTDQDFALACYNCVLGADFTLSADPEAFEVCAPDTVTSTIQVGQVLNYSHDVTLEMSDLPVGVAAEIVPAVVTPPGEAVLTLEVGDMTPDGVYTLTLTGTGEVTNVHMIEFGLLVRSAPAIALTSDALVELGHTMHFTAEHTGGSVPLTYTWDFGGPGYGANLGTATPVYTYTDYGSYTVVVTAENECGDDTDSAQVEVVCYGPQVEISSESPVELGEAIHFAANVLTGTIPHTYTWDFGGAGYGTGLDTATPVFTYTSPGNYMATVTVMNACDSDADSALVEVLCYEPEATVATNSPVMIGEAMHFSATLTGTAPLSYTWDFGGPGSGDGLDTLTPVYTYTLPGDYVVSLQVTGPCGLEMVTETVTVDATAYYIYLPLVRK